MIISDQEVSWAYLLGPCFQLQNTKGVPLTGGYIEVYIHGTRDKYYCASDFAGTLHPFQIPLDSLGSNIVLASPEQAYDVYVYNRFGSLIMSRYNVIPVNGTSEGGGGTSNINITSSDGTITVTDTLDPETGIKTYDLSVPWASGDASYWHSRGASNQGQIISDTDTHVLLISEHAIDHEGEDITVGSDGKFHLKEGVYFWTVNVDLYSDSLSNNTQQIYINSNINRASYKMDMTRDNQHSVSFSGITVATQDDYQEGFTIKTEGQTIRAGIYEVAIHKLNPKVLGTKYDAGYGIVIEDDTISVDPEVIPSVSTVSGMIQEAVTSIPEYTAGEYIKIEDNEISVTGLQPAGDYLTQEDLEGYATETYVDNSVSSFVTEETVTALIQEAVTSIEPGEIYTPGEYVKIEDNVISVTGLQPAGDYLTSEDLEGYATETYVTTYVDNSVSSFTTEQEVTTLIQEAITAIAPEPELPLVAGDGITITEYEDRVEIAVNVTSIDGYATLNDVAESAVTSIQLVTGMIPDVSDYSTHDEVHEATVTAIEYVTGIIPDAQVQSNWTETDNEDPSYIQNKPDEYSLIAGQNIGITLDTVNREIVIAASATDLSDCATKEELQDVVELVTGMIPDVSDFTTNNDVHESIVTAIEYVTGIIPDAQVQSNWAETDNTDPSYIQNKPNEYTVVAGDNIGIMIDNNDLVISASGVDLSDYTTFEDVVAMVSSVTGIGDYGQFYSTNITGAATMSRTKGTIEVTNDGKIKLKKGQSYHVTVRGVYNQTSPTNVYGDVSYIEYITGQSIHVNVDKTITDSQYFEISYDIYKLNNDSDYYVFLSMNGGTVNDLFIEIHAIGSVGVGGSGGGGGTEYDAGWGIQILNNVISVNPSIIPVVTGFATHDEVFESSVTAIQMVTGLIPDVSDFTTETQVTALIQEAVTSIEPGTTYTAGDYISIENNEISVTGTEDLTMKNLTAGEGITISESGDNIVISASVTSVSGYVTDEELQDAVELVTGLIPTVQLNGNDQVTAINNHAIAGGSGSSYTAGNGIDITNNVISVDNTVALKTDIPEEEEVEFEEINLSDYALVSAIPDVSNLATKVELQDGLELVTGLIPDVSNYATHGEVFESSVTAIQMVTGLIPEAQVQSNWTETDNTDPAYILNKPSEKSLVAGDGISITVDGTDVIISASVTGNPTVTGYVTDEELQDAVEFVTGLIPTVQLNSDNQVTAINNHAIAGGGGGTTYTAGDYISIENNEISVTGVAPATAIPESEEVDFEEIDLTSFALASAVPEYTAGDNIDITNDVISVTGTEDLTLMNLTAGNGISITADVSGNVEIACTGGGGSDETTLFENASGTTTNITLSEALTNFKTCKVYGFPQELTTTSLFVEEWPATTSLFGIARWVYIGGNANYPYVLYCTRYDLSGTTLTFDRCNHTWFDTSFVKQGQGSNSPIMITKIVGIGRVSGGNN